MNLRKLSLLALSLLVAANFTFGQVKKKSAASAKPAAKAQAKGELLPVDPGCDHRQIAQWADLLYP